MISSKKWWALVLILILAMGVSTRIACVTGPVSSEVIEQMSQDDFTVLKQEVTIATRLALRDVVGKKPAVKETLGKFVTELKAIAESKDGNLDAAIDNLLNGLNDPDIKDAISLALVVVKQHGGMQYFDVNGTKVLSPRSMELVLALLDGIQSIL